MPVVARDLMQTRVVTVSPDTPLSSVRQLFIDEGIHGAPVVDERRKLLGVISTTDLLRAASQADEVERPESYYDGEGVEDFTLAGLDARFKSGLGEASAADHMTDSVVAVDPEQSVPELARAFRTHGVHRVLVVDHGVLRGIISTLDLIGLLEQPGFEVVERAAPAAS